MKVKKKKLFYEILSTCLIIASIIFFISCVTLSIHIYKYANIEHKDFAEGISYALALILLIVLSIINLPITIFSIVFSKMAHTQKSIIGYVILIISLSIFTLTIGNFIGLLII